MRNPYRKLSNLNIQPEKGTRRIANDLFIALIMAGFNEVEYRILMMIINDAWGWQKQTVNFTFQEMADFLTVTRPTIIKYVRLLELKQVLIVDRQLVNGHLPVNMYSINKFYDTWQAITSKPPFTTTGKPLFTSSTVQLVNEIVSTGIRSSLKLVNDGLPPAVVLKKERKERAELSKSAALPDDNGKGKSSADEGQTELDSLGKKYAKKNKLKTVLDEPAPAAESEDPLFGP
ncbi:hypothetical protein LCGC14_1290730 [marine sediment metagenome]|uniref:Bacteriophage lambda Replication protein O N-terminal domain-containing protein n=1 Tax=marine sediment metagenome TaxID=412755 RepID=A0A0F9KU81_9ZZZZ